MTTAPGRRLLVALVSVGLLLGLGACTTGGTAVQSLSVTYSERDVTVLADEMAQVVGQNSFSRQDAVGMLVQVQPLFAAAEAEGVTIDEEYVEGATKMFLDDLDSRVDPNKLSPVTKEVLTSITVSAALTPAFQLDPELGPSIMALMSPPETIVNPRYLSVTPDGLFPPQLLGDVVEQELSPMPYG